jgi:hypothetical protein
MSAVVFSDEGERLYLALENATTLAAIDDVAWQQEVSQEITRAERNALRVVWNLRREELAADLMRGQAWASFATVAVAA